MHLKILIDKDLNHLEQLSEQFDQPLEGDCLLHVPEKFGQGYVRCFTLPFGITFYIYRFELIERLDLSSTNPKNSDVFVMNFNLSESDYSKFINGKEITIGKELPSGVFFYSPGNSSYGFADPGIPYTFLFITVHGKLLRERYHNGHELSMLASSDIFLHYEDLDSVTANTFYEIIDRIERDELSEMWLDSRILEITYQLLKKFSLRDKLKVKLNPNDINVLFQTRALLKSHLYQSPPKIKELSAISGMSPTKFKSSFKELFGLTPYQFFLQQKMLEAKKLLETQKFTVKEVGYQMGYSNISHFIEAFEKQMSTKPSLYITRGK